MLGVYLETTVTVFAGETRLAGASVSLGGRSYQLDELGSAMMTLNEGTLVFEGVVDGEEWSRHIDREGTSARFVVDTTGDEVTGHPFPELVGLVGDRFLIRSIVARAATGTVVQAFDRLNAREIALRAPSDEMSSKEEANQVFLVEARNLVGVEHPNLLTIYDVLAVKGRGILVTGWVEGETLDRWMREGRLGREDAWDIMLPLASGVAQLHREDIVHRDLHGANVIVRKGGGAKLIDLGLARSLADIYLGAARVHATKEHCAPEQFQGLHVTPATDVYQLTMLFFRIWSGRWPFESGDIEWAHVHEEAMPLPDAPELLQALVARGLAKNPRARFVDAEEWFRSFSSLREHLSVQAELARTEEARWPLGTVAALIGLVAVMAGVIAFVMVFVMAGEGEAPVELGDEGSVTRSQDGVAPSDGTEVEPDESLAAERGGGLEATEPGVMGTEVAAPGLAEPGVDETGLAEPGVDETGLADPGVDETGLDETGLVEPGVEEPGVNESGATGRDGADVVAPEHDRGDVPSLVRSGEQRTQSPTGGDAVQSPATEKKPRRSKTKRSGAGGAGSTEAGAGDRIGADEGEDDVELLTVDGEDPNSIFLPVD